jgi:hypothetical protein
MTRVLLGSDPQVYRTREHAMPQRMIDELETIDSIKEHFTLV